MNDIVKKEAVNTPDNLLAIAVQNGANVDQLEKLMSLKDAFEESEARKAFSEALAGFQSELSPIVKQRKGHNSSYADIDDIAQSVRPIMSKYGLSYRFEQTQADGSITVTCIVGHKLGHAEKTTMSASADTSGGKNAIQAIASAVTYLRRYTLTGALGITTGNDDDDGGKPAVTTEDLLTYINVVREEFQSIASIKSALLENNFSYAKECWQELGQDLVMSLWRAPSKGGIFTTQERDKMKSTDFRQA